MVEEKTFCLLKMKVFVLVVDWKARVATDTLCWALARKVLLPPLLEHALGENEGILVCLKEDGNVFFAFSN